MTTEQQRAGNRASACRRPSGPDRTIRAGIGGTAVAVVLASLAACGQPAAGPTDGVTTPAGGSGGAQSPAIGTSPSASAPTTSTGGSGEPGRTSQSGKPGKPSSSAKPTAAQPSSGTGAKSCANLAGDLSLHQQVGQLFMAATSSSGMSDAEARRLASLKVGSVLLLGNSTAGRSTVAAVTGAIRQRVGSDHGVKVLLAADQEGGEVQRLAGPGFDVIPSAEEQASLSDDQLRSDAEQWGRQLADAGVDVNLAPVSDVVPSSIGAANQPIGALHRGYGSKPARVARKNVAFIKGMEAAGVATSVKHFPGLGIVRGNTDISTDVTDTVTTRDDKRLAGFRAGVQAGVDMVMVSSATYTKIDPGGPATFSTTVNQTMIRDDLGFDGVIISDDLLGKALSGVPVGQRALRFFRAGGDLAIVGQPADVAPMVGAVRRAAAKDPRLRSQVQDAASRVLIMKARHGLVDCAE